MTIQERMVARSEREKDLLKYGRSQERERIIKLLKDNFNHEIQTAPRLYIEGKPLGPLEFIHSDNCYGCRQIALIKGEK